MDKNETLKFVRRVRAKIKRGEPTTFAERNVLSIIEKKQAKAKSKK